MKAFLFALLFKGLTVGWVFTDTAVEKALEMTKDHSE